MVVHRAASMEPSVQETIYFVSTGNSVFINDSGEFSNSSNGTGDPEQLGQPWGLPFQIFICSILTVISFLTISGNLMVITVVVRHRGMRTRTNLFLVNMAVADFLVGSLVVPFAIVTIIKGDWIFGDVFCTINGFLNCFCMVASLHTLMYISIHKYYSIVHPFSHTLKLRRILMMMCAAWVWAGFSATITVWGLTHVLYKYGTSQCGPEYPNMQEMKSVIHHTIIQVSDIFLPLGIMIFCYAKIFKEIRSHSRRLQENSTLEKDAVVAQQKKVTMTLFIVLACFVICWLPYHAYAMFVAIRKDKHGFNNYLNPSAYLFTYLNSACNPIIYAWRSPSFREGYKEILCQTPQYVISDDTIREEGQGPFRRLSSFLNMSHSLRRSQNLQNGGSPGPTFRDRLTGSARLPSSGQPSRFPANRGRRNKSLGQLMRAASKLGQGHCIIRRDGSFVLMKFGKVVSVKRESDSPMLRRMAPQGASGGRFGPPTQRHAPGEGMSNGNLAEVLPPGDCEAEVMPLMGNMAAACPASPLHEADESISCGSDEVFVEILDASDDAASCSECVDDPQPCTSSQHDRSKARQTAAACLAEDGRARRPPSLASEKSFHSQNGGTVTKTTPTLHISPPGVQGVAGRSSSESSDPHLPLKNGEAGKRASVVVTLPCSGADGSVQIRISPASDLKPQTPMYKDRLTRSDWSLKRTDGGSKATAEGLTASSQGLKQSKSALALKQADTSSGLKQSRSAQGLTTAAKAGSSRALNEAGSSQAVHKAGGSQVQTRRKKTRMPSVERLDIPVVVRKSASTTNLNSRSRSPSPLFRRKRGSWRSSNSSVANV